MQDIAEFCNKTITETNSAVEITKGKVVSTTTVTENKNIMDAITKNQETCKQHRGKQKKFHFLKYNSPKK